MPNNSDIKSFQDEQIDLGELWMTLIKRKLTILMITITLMLVATVYVWMATPIYRGEVLIEIGKVLLNDASINDKPTMIQDLEKSGDLEGVINQVFNADITDESKKIKIDLPKGSQQLVLISYENSDKQLILKKLGNIVNFVLKRHQNSADFFQKENNKIYPSSIIGGIQILSDPVKPKKQLILMITFLAGLFLGIFTVLFSEFVLNGKKEDKCQ